MCGPQSGTQLLGVLGLLEEGLSGGGGAAIGHVKYPQWYNCFLLSLSLLSGSHEVGSSSTVLPPKSGSSDQGMRSPKLFPSSWDVEAGILGVQGQPQIHSEFQASLDYMRCCLKTTPKFGVDRLTQEPLPQTPR